MCWQTCHSRCRDEQIFPFLNAIGQKNPARQLTHLKLGAYHQRLPERRTRANRRGRRAVKSLSMEKKKLDAFKKRLEARQQELRRMVSRTEQDGRTVDDDSAQDIADRAASSYTKEFLFHQSNNDRQLLQMVENALSRIREGTFGECISCGKDINAKRLEAVPWTRHCIECQEKLEQGRLEEASK
jgi:DnaK suppressor protein